MTQAPTAARSAPKTLPRPIRRVLGRLDRRFRLVGACRGLGTAALVVAAGAAVGMAADFAWDLPRAARWAIWGTWLATVVGLIVAAFRPLVRRSGALALAALAERSHPQLGERLTAAVALFDERDARRPPHGSPALIAALADEAAARVGAIDPGRAIPMGAAGRRLALGVGALMLIAAPGVIRPDPFGTLARRFLAPWADVERVGRFVVSVTPGDHTAARGADLTVSARIRSRFGAGPVPRTAWLEWTEEKGGTRRRMAMSAAPSGQGPFAGLRDHVAGALGLVDVPGRRRVGRQPGVSRHCGRAAGGRRADRADRPPALQRAPRRERPRPRPDRGPGGEPDHARGRDDRAGPHDRRRVAGHPSAGRGPAGGGWQDRVRHAGRRRVRTLSHPAPRRARPDEPRRAHAPGGGRPRRPADALRAGERGDGGVAPGRRLARRGLGARRPGGRLGRAAPRDRAGPPQPRRAEGRGGARRDSPCPAWGPGPRAGRRCWT